MMLFLFFFLKQKTAYEMRISDWCSDVCFSDLLEIIEILNDPAGNILPHQRSGNTYCVGDADGVGPAVTFHHKSVQPQKHRAIMVVGVQMNPQHLQRGPRHEKAEL